MDSLTDEEFQEWKAVAVIDGWANGWSQTAELLAALNYQTNRTVLLQLDSSDAKRAADKMDWKSGHEIATMMTDYSKKKPKPRGLSVNQARQFFKARFG